MAWLRRFGAWFAHAGRGVALIVLLVLVAIRIADPAPVELLRQRGFDLMQQGFPRELPQRAAVIIGIDEKSLDVLGQWPWPREVIAQILEQLARYGVAAVGFDVVFAEADRSKVRTAFGGSDAGLSLGLPGEPLDHDRRMATALTSLPSVLGQSGTSETVLSTVELRSPAGFALIGRDPRPLVPGFPGLVANIPVLSEAASGIGVFSLVPERDGVVRRVPMLVNIGDKLFPALSLELVRALSGQSTYVVHTNEAGLEKIDIAGGSIPTDGAGRLWIHYSAYDPERIVSAVDVLRGEADPAALANKVALVGAAALGLGDVKALPLGLFAPGVEVHAQILDSILMGGLLQRPAWIDLAEASVLLLLGLALIAVLPRIGARWTVPLLTIVLAALVGGVLYLFVKQQVLVDASAPIFGLTLTFLTLVYFAHAQEARQRAQIRDMFGRYLAPTLVNQLAEQPGQLELGGETRQLTLMFVDIRGFTTLSERFRGDPAGLTTIINRFLTPMSDAVLEAEGTIDKYMGDAMMAFWNAPLDVPAHADKACSAALKMRDALVELNAAFVGEAGNGEPLQLNMGIGLATGSCLVGNMGSNQRFDYSALGDPVNLASRLEGLTKLYGVTTLVADTTVQAAPTWAWLLLDRVAVKGREASLPVYALFGDRSFASTAGFQATWDGVERFHTLYLQRDWPAAERTLQGLHDAEPGLRVWAALFLARIDAYRDNPPPFDWDGTFRATEK